MLDSILNILGSVLTVIGYAVSIVIAMFNTLNWWQLLIVGFVAIGICSLIIKLIQGILSLIFAVIFFIGLGIANLLYFILHYKFALVSTIGVYVYCYYQNITIDNFIIGGSVLLYLWFSTATAASEGKRTLCKKIDLRFEQDGIGIISKSIALRLTPYKKETQYNALVRYMIKAFYKPNEAVAYLDKMVKKGKLKKEELTSGIDYYFTDEKLKAFKEDVDNRLHASLEKYFSKYGIINEKRMRGIFKDISSGEMTALRTSVLKEYVEKFFQEKEKQIILKKMPYDDGEEMNYFVDTAVTRKLSSSLAIKDIISLDVLYRTFAIENNMADRENTIKILSSIDHNFSFSLIKQKINGNDVYYYLNDKQKAKYTCERCHKVFRRLQQYKGKNYCASCLEEVKKEAESGVVTEKRVIEFNDIPPAMRAKLLEQEKKKNTVPAKTVVPNRKRNNKRK